MAKIWELFGRLGQAVLELLGAELGALRNELRTTGRRALVLLLWLMVCAQLVVLSVALLAIGVARGLELHLPVWAAALLPGATTLVVAAGLGLWAWRSLLSLEPPLDTVTRRFEEHSEWWNERVVGQQEPDDSPPREVDGE